MSSSWDLWDIPIPSLVIFIWKLTDFWAGRLISEVFPADFKTTPISKIDLCHLINARPNIQSGTWETCS